MSDLIDRQAAIDALWKALYEYEDKTEKQFQESDELDISDWLLHRIYVQNMSDIDRQTILNLPPAQPEPKRGRWIYKTDLITAPTGYWECSECKEGRLLYEENFCPHCGAVMREVTT